jgi:hypothetical protein
MYAKALLACGSMVRFFFCSYFCPQGKNNYKGDKSASRTGDARILTVPVPGWWSER